MQRAAPNEIFEGEGCLRKRARNFDRKRARNFDSQAPENDLPSPDNPRVQFIAEMVSGGYSVAVMQSTKSRPRDHLVAMGRHGGRHSTAGRVLPESEMGSVLVVIANVFIQQSSQCF